MVELIVVLILVSVALFIIGVPMVTYISWALIIMDVLLGLSVIFFVISIIMLLFSKREKVDFIGTKSNESSKIKYAYYKVIDCNKEVKNLYPTDSFSEKIFYKKKETTVSVLRLKRKIIVFDTPCILTMCLGLVMFLGCILVATTLLTVLRG